MTNDDLARWIRRDFPDHRNEASVIKNLKEPDRIARTLELYDTVILPMEMCERPDELALLPDKDRITLFANADCALTCPARICYTSTSKIDKGQNVEWRCSPPVREHVTRGMIDFVIDALAALGFRRFKLLRARPGNRTGF